jgi:hypothetical protein
MCGKSAVGKQATGFAILPEADARQPRSTRHLSDAPGVGNEQPIIGYRQRFDPRLGGSEGSAQLVEKSHVHALQLDIERLSPLLHDPDDRHHREFVRVHEDSRSNKIWNQRLHEFQPFRIELFEEEG